MHAIDNSLGRQTATKRRQCLLLIRRQFVLLDDHDDNGKPMPTSNWGGYALPGHPMFPVVCSVFTLKRNIGTFGGFVSLVKGEIYFPENLV